MKLLLLLTMLAGRPVAAQDGSEPGADDAADAQPLAEPPLNAPPATPAEVDRITDEVSDGLRCPVCQGLSVNDSPADGARSMKARIRELVAQGYTREQIEDYFVDRYGTWVLLAPPATGQHWTVYLAPALFLVGGFGGIGWYLRTRSRDGGASAEADRAAAPAQRHDDELEPYRRRILAELGLPAHGEGA